MLFQLEQTSQDTLFENDLLEHSSSTPSLGSSFVDLVSEKAAIHTICDYAIQRWRTTFDRSEFIEKLKAYDEYFRNGGTVEDRNGELDELFRYFKNIRKSVLYLRTVKELFDQNHDCPEELKLFSWSLGQFKDTFHRPELAIKHELSLFDYVNDSSGQLETIEIKESDSVSVLAYVENPLSTIESLIDLSELPARKFHKLRKRLRIFSIIFTIAVENSTYTQFSALKDYMVMLNDELGEINDELIATNLNGGTEYDQQVVTLSPELKQKIRKLL